MRWKSRHWWLSGMLAVVACGEATGRDAPSLESSDWALVTRRERSTMIHNANGPMVAGPITAPAPSGKCMDVTSGAVANGTPVQAWDCNDTDAQLWTIEGWSVIGVGSGRCLEVLDNNATNGTPVQIWDCNGSPQQRWSATSSGQLRSQSTGKCLDISGQGGSGSPLEIRDCSSRGSQRWTRAATVLRSVGASKCVTLAPATWTVFMSTCAGLPTQQWIQTTYGDELYNPATQLCLSAWERGRVIGLDECYGDSPWYRDANGFLRHGVTTACMDVQWGNPAEGTPIQLWDCNGTTFQDWTTR